MTPAPKAPETYVMRDLVLPNDANQYQTLFGGVLLSYMDKAAFIAACKFCGHAVVTASVDVVHFIRPIFVGDMVRIEGRVVDAGRTSMSVRVRVYREGFDDPDGQFCCSGIFNMVAVDKGMRPIEVPALLLENDDDKAEAARAKEVRQSLKAHRDSRGEQ